MNQGFLFVLCGSVRLCVEKDLDAVGRWQHLGCSIIAIMVVFVEATSPEVIDIVKRTKRGEEFLLTVDGKPMARITAFEAVPTAPEGPPESES